MANLLRGEVPFSAAGRDLFLQYKTREVAEIQAALGFRRPDPFQPDTVEDVGVVLSTDPEMLGTRQMIIDADERQRRMVAAFEAAWMNPDPQAALVCFRIGLQPWERQTGTKLTDAAFHEIVDAVGLATLKLLNRGYYGKMDEAVVQRIKELFSRTSGLIGITLQLLC